MHVLAKIHYQNSELYTCGYSGCPGVAVQRLDLRIDYCVFWPFSSTPINLMISIYLLWVLICIMH